MSKFCPYCGNKIEEQEKSGFQCPNCKLWIHYSSNPAVSVVVRVGDEALIAVRGRDPGKGLDDWVGGFLEYGEDPKIGAVREFKEEVGVDINAEDLELLGMWIDDYEYQGEKQWILNIGYLLEFPEKFEGKAADDVESLRWVSINDHPKFAFSWLNKAWEKISK